MRPALELDLCRDSADRTVRRSAAGIAPARRPYTPFALRALTWIAQRTVGLQSPVRALPHAIRPGQNHAGGGCAWPPSVDGLGVICISIGRVGLVKVEVIPVDAHRIELGNVVASLRSEINNAWREGQYDAVGFEAGPIEVELTTEIEVIDVGGKVSARFWVLSAEAEARHSRTSTQRISFSLTPRDRRDPSRPLLIGEQTDADEPRPPVSQDEDAAAIEEQPPPS
jgi:hypothetical protein